jgi:hypothetical protein
LALSPTGPATYPAGAASFTSALWWIDNVFGAKSAADVLT